MANKYTNRGDDGVISPRVSSDELDAAAKKARSAESEMVNLVALTMKTSSSLQVPAARGFKFVNVEPLGVSPQVPKSFAEKVVGNKRSNSNSVRPVIVWHICPDKRPKSAKDQHFQTSDGLTFRTDVYAPPEGLEINGRKIYHSVSQAQHFIGRVLRTKEGIQRFITEFDTRPDVAAYGNYVINLKDREQREMIGANAQPLVTV